MPPLINPLYNVLAKIFSPPDSEEYVCRNKKLHMKLSNTKKFLAYSFLLGSIALSVVSCTKDDTIPVVENAKLLVVHASPDAPGVDLLVDDVKVNTAALSFPNNTGYLTITAGTRNLKVNAAGTATTVINANVPFTKDMSYSLFAVDSLSKISTVLLQDDLTVPASGKSHVRFVHLSPDAPAVDIAVAGGGPVVFSNRAFKESTAFTPLDAGTYNLEVRVAGTATVALTLPPITLVNGKIYTVFAKGFLAGMGAQALGAEIVANN
jgi:hypothetical protein